MFLICLNLIDPIPETAFLTHVSSMLITFVTIALFHHMDMTAGRIFAALALFNQLTVPLFIFPITVPIIISAIVSTKRLERFFALPEVQKEFEGIRKMAHVMSRSDASLDIFEIEDNESRSEVFDDVAVSSNCDNTLTSSDNSASATEVAASSVYAGFMNDIDNSRTGPEKAHIRREQPLSASVNLRKSKRLSSNPRTQWTRGRQISVPNEQHIEISSDLSVCIRNGVFKWSTDAAMAEGSPELSLKIDNLEIPKGRYAATYSCIEQQYRMWFRFFFTSQENSQSLSVGAVAGNHRFWQQF